jgi:hypothetical protein
MSIWSGMTTLGVQLQLKFYSLTGSVVGTSSSVTTTLNQTGWNRITVTGIAPAGAAFAIPQIVTQAATTSATTLQATAWQLEQSASSTSFATSGGWNQMWQGFVERWPQRYDKNGKYGLIDITAVDALAPLSQLTFANAIATYMDQQGPQYQFDLAAVGSAPDKPAGKAFPDLNGSGVGLDLVGSAITTGVSISSANQLGTLWNADGPVITLSNNQASSQGNAANASYLQWANSSGKTVTLPSAGWTRMICFRTGVTPGTGSTYTLSTLWAVTAGGFLSGTGDQSGAYLYIDSNGHVALNVKNSAGTALGVINTSIFVCDNDWHCAVASLSSDGKTIHVTVDGVYWFNTSSTGVASSTYTQDAVGTLIEDGGVDTQPFNGDLAWIAQWNTELSVNAQLDITLGFSSGWTGDSNPSRFNRILSLASFHPGSITNLSYVGSNAILGSISINGRSPLDVLQECADTECGQFTIDRNGNPSLHGQLWRWQQSQPKVTFGESVTSGEVPYKADITFEQDPAHLYNDIQVTCDGSQDLTSANALQEVQDATSQANYFPQTLQKTLNPQLVQGGLNVASYLLSQYKDPHTRLSGLSVDCASNPSALPALVNLNFADLVQVNRRPAEAPMKSLSCFIEQVSWSGDDTGKNLVASFQMSPASQYKYGIISATWGQLTAGIAAGVSTITVGKLNNVNLIAAQYVIPANYQMTLGFGTANAETVTIQSVQVVSAGYTSVQLTLASPTTKSHSASDYLCDIEPGNITLPPVGSYPTCFDNSSLTGGTQPLIGF